MAHLMAALIVRVWGLCLALSSAALVLGAVLASASLQPSFTACELPCWGGLLPGETAFNAVAPTLNQSLAPETLRVASNAVLFKMLAGDQMISGFVSFTCDPEIYPEPLIATIYLNTEVPFRFLLDQLSTPDCVWISNTNNSPSLYFVGWQGDTVWVKASVWVEEGERLNAMNTQVMAHDLEIGAFGSICDGNGALAWLGFAPAWRYTAFQKKTYG